MEQTIGDSLRAYAKIEYALPDNQRCIIHAMGMCSDLIQVYCSTQRKIFWDMTGMKGRIPHRSSVNALIRKNIIVPTISNKEWEVQIALGTAEKRVWKINPVIFDPLINAICLIRTIKEKLTANAVCVIRATEEKLKAGGVFGANL